MMRLFWECRQDELANKWGSSMLTYGPGSIPGLAEPLVFLQHHGQDTPSRSCFGHLVLACALFLRLWNPEEVKPHWRKWVTPGITAPLPVCRHHAPLAASGSCCQDRLLATTRLSSLEQWESESD